MATCVIMLPHCAHQGLLGLGDDGGVESRLHVWHDAFRPWVTRRGQMALEHCHGACTCASAVSACGSQRGMSMAR